MFQGLVLCQIKEVGLISINHWKSLTDFKQDLKLSDRQFRQNILQIMWKIDLRKAKLQRRRPI
jgi:hypothetical protein